MQAWNRRRFLRTTTAAGLAVPAAGLARDHRLAGRSGQEGEQPGAGPSVPPAKSSLDDPLGVRPAFPVTQELAYLNTASVGPLPAAVHDALRDYAEGKSLLRDRDGRAAMLEQARASFASVFGADADEVAMLYSTSDAENVIAQALDWRPGDNVVVDELHFTTTFVLYRELERRRGVELRIVPARQGAVSAEDFAARTDRRTRLISVAWVSNRNGFRHDLPALAELAHSNDAFLYADAIQAFGTFPLNLHDEQVDFACGNGYKWLFADFGCAPFYVRREHLEWMTPDRYGHRQVAEDLPGRRYRLKTTAAKFEYGNASHGSVAAMDAALRFVAGVGFDRVADHTHALAARLRDGAEALGMELFTPPANPSPIVSFYHGLDHQTLSAALEAEGVAVTFQEDGRLLRAAVAMFNNQDDVNRLLQVVERLA